MVAAAIHFVSMCTQNQSKLFHSFFYERYRIEVWVSENIILSFVVKWNEQLNASQKQLSFQVHFNRKIAFRQMESVV